MKTNVSFCYWFLLIQTNVYLAFKEYETNDSPISPALKSRPFSFTAFFTEST